MRTDDVLSHRSRKLIFNYILIHPGSSFGAIKDFLDINESTLKYHLRFLERSNRIISKREGRRRCYYCEKSLGYERERYSSSNLEFLNKRQLHILNIIRRRSSITKKELIKITQMNRTTLDYNLNKLIAEELVWQTSRENGTRYEYVTTERLQNKMFNRLVMKLLSDEIDEETFHRVKKKLESLDVDEV